MVLGMFKQEARGCGGGASVHGCAFGLRRSSLHRIYSWCWRTRYSPIQLDAQLTSMMQPHIHQRNNCRHLDVHSLTATPTNTRSRFIHAARLRGVVWWSVPSGPPGAQAAVVSVAVFSNRFLPVHQRWRGFGRLLSLVTGLPFPCPLV